jgi:hypothetical protein
MKIMDKQKSIVKNAIGEFNKIKVLLKTGEVVPLGNNPASYVLNILCVALYTHDDTDFAEYVDYYAKMQAAKSTEGMGTESLKMLKETLEEIKKNGDMSNPNKIKLYVEKLSKEVANGKSEEEQRPETTE